MHECIFRYLCVKFPSLIIATRTSARRYKTVNQFRSFIIAYSLLILLRAGTVGQFHHTGLQQHTLEDSINIGISDLELIHSLVGYLC